VCERKIDFLRFRLSAIVHCLLVRARTLAWRPAGSGGGSGRNFLLAQPCCAPPSCVVVRMPTEGAERKRCVVVMYDTLCRHFIPSYGNSWIQAPNFTRLSERAVQFQNAYVGSMPCMPCRREMCVKAPHARCMPRDASRASWHYDCTTVAHMAVPVLKTRHTGRHNFLHRSWGPLEPFDDSMPEQLHQAGVHSHKVTDHHHYWEDGGATYHQRFRTHEFVRGQEGDWWIGDVGKLRDGSFPSGQEVWPE
jgi:hypothetical protein